MKYCKSFSKGGRCNRGYHICLEFITRGRPKGSTRPSLSFSMSRPYVGSPSALVFGPQSKKPQPEYLKSIRTILCCESDLSPLVKLVRHLPSIWKVYLAHNGNLSAVTHAAHEMQALSDWIKTGACRSIAASDSGITSFPLMTIIQAGQYFHFLRQHGLSHRTYINSVRDRGGIQGYCTGLLLSASVACSDAERDLVENLCRALRLAVGLGAYSDLAALQSTHPFASKVVRFREEGQLEKILKSYTEVSILVPSRPISDDCQALCLSYHRPQHNHALRA